MAQRKKSVTMKGRQLTLIGEKLEVGDRPARFEAVGLGMGPWDSASLAGMVCILSSVPSLDTAVCDRQSRRFDEQANLLGADVKVITISMDLPFAMKRWAERAGVTKLELLSDHRTASFGEAFGMLIEELRLLGRGVFVVDRAGTVRYCEISEDLAQEPDYDGALTAARRVM